MLSKPAILVLIQNQLNDLVSKDHFLIRTILQKTIFLLQERGLDLGYHYRGYSNGPYCPELADDAYELQFHWNEYQKDAFKYNLKNDIIELIKNYKDQMGHKAIDETWLAETSKAIFKRKMVQ